MRFNRSLATVLALATLVPLAACGSSTMEAMHEGHLAGDVADGDSLHVGHNMDLGPADATYDLRFIDGMIPHHEGALVMAEAALAHSQRPEIRQLAENIIAAQQVEIAQMQEWRAAWYPDAPTVPMMYHAEMSHDMPMSKEMIAAMRMDVDLGGADGEFDQRFIDGMIPHHEGAVMMAEDLKVKSTRPELQTLADEIIASQQAEIDQMNQWRQDWYGQ
ncbi:DUF305 domain-containing protein [Nodosilinea sp. LEGE 07298]|uniref:DUF305 domain-containing protein n=1 Tax=Nodosilinea sp. LEGE 07298 TaxID=2777970 RepID=UPI0018819C8B|nr:DUF305 domain-containing protein [Nodosilinea sp. LEGE 07298]MBE9111558.1 DUF305 domain-containing protein [Nodosilinea sp. LEGE 07298]